MLLLFRNCFFFFPHYCSQKLDFNVKLDRDLRPHCLFAYGDTKLVVFLLV